MGTVYGPYDMADWYTMKALKEDEAFMKGRDREKFAIAIRWTRDTLKNEFYSRQCAA